MIHSPLIAIMLAQVAITSISPSSAAVGSSDLTLTVSGTGFTDKASVRWLRTGDGTGVITIGGDAGLATTFVSSSRLTATIPSALLSTVGTAAVSVIVPVRGTVFNVGTGQTTTDLTSHQSTSSMAFAISQATTAPRPSITTRLPITTTRTPATTTPTVSITKFYVGSATNPDTVVMGQVIPLYVERASNSLAPTHWRAGLLAEMKSNLPWTSVSLPPRYVFSGAGPTTLHFRYARIVGSDTTFSNTMLDAAYVRGPTQ